MAFFRIASLVALVACCLLVVKADDSTTEDSPTTSSPSSDRSFSIEESNAPNTQYEWDAVQCLSEAYMLHPNSFDTIVETYAQLYKLKHSGTWNVNAGCSSLYTPKADISIVVKVTEGSDETLITLYN